ncbi:M56 family metallopeptidase [Tundrisphaera sp. TA3]|uniref:M56 family metallopeptidase n=1 Tax=Tundrisphaera sp. TA3 TaxID=3435775 RepID=UPI003EBA2192
MLWWFAQTTMVAAALAAVALLAGRWRRVGPEARHALWLLVLIKLMMPPFVGWSWTVPKFPERPPILVAASREVRPAPEVLRWDDAEVLRWDDAEEIPIADDPAIPEEPRPQARDLLADPAPTPAPVLVPAIHETPQSPVSLNNRGPTPIPWDWIALRAWWIGTLVVVAWELSRIARFGWRLRRGVPAPAWLEAEVDAVAGRFGVRPPPTRVVDGVSTPVLWCPGRPRLYLPSGLVASLTADRWRGVLGHEMAHLARRDHWVSRLELAAVALWWWNPLFWLARRRLRDEAERACDARVVRAWPDHRLTYAESLVDVCERLSRPAMPSPALGVGGGSGAARSLERRLSMILRDPIAPPAPFRTALAVGLLAALALPAWTFGQQPDPPTEAITKHPAATPLAEAPKEAAASPTAARQVDPAGRPIGIKPDGSQAPAAAEPPGPAEAAKPPAVAADLTIPAIAEAVAHAHSRRPSLSFRYVVSQWSSQGGTSRNGVQVADVLLDGASDDHLRIDAIGRPLSGSEGAGGIRPARAPGWYFRRFLARSPMGEMTLALSSDQAGPVLMDWKAIHAGLGGMRTLGSSPLAIDQHPGSPLDPGPESVLNYDGRVGKLLGGIAQAEIAGTEVIDGEEAVRIAWIANRLPGYRGLLWLAPRKGFALLRSEEIYRIVPTATAGMGSIQHHQVRRKQAGDFVAVGDGWMPRTVTLMDAGYEPQSDPSAPPQLRFRRELKIQVEDYRGVTTTPEDFRPKLAIRSIDEKTGQFLVDPPPLPDGLLARLERAAREASALPIDPLPAPGDAAPAAARPAPGSTSGSRLKTLSPRENFLAEGRKASMRLDALMAKKDRTPEEEAELPLLQATVKFFDEAGKVQPAGSTNRDRTEDAEAPARTSLADLRDSVELAELQVANLRKESDRIQHGLSRARDRRANLTADRPVGSEARTNADRLDAEIDDLRDRAARLESELPEAELRLKQARRRVEAEEARIRREIERAKSRLDWAEKMFSNKVMSEANFNEIRDRYDDLMIQIDPDHKPTPTPKKP